MSSNILSMIHANTIIKGMDGGKLFESPPLVYICRTKTIKKKPTNLLIHNRI